MREGGGKITGTGWFIHNILHVMEANLGEALILTIDLMSRWLEGGSLLAGNLVSRET
jgi:hypothetical protein